MIRGHSLRWHLGIFSLLIIAPVLLLGVILSTLYVRREKALIEDNAGKVVQNAANIVDEELDRYVVAVQTLATLPRAGNDLQALYKQGLRMGELLHSPGLQVRDPNGR